VKASEVRDRLQLTKPEPGDEVIELPPAPAAVAPGAVDANGNPLVKADLTPKANPHPEINPTSDTRAMMTAPGSLYGRLLAKQTAGAPDVVEALEERLAQQASEALASMTAEVQACFTAATDMADLSERLAKLKLDNTAFQTAMMQGMALANLAGQAALLDEIAPHAAG
jgi:hypothetical protein